MFTMEYRKPLANLGHDSRKIWLEMDIMKSPAFLVKNLVDMLDTQSITPVYSRSTGVSFKYSNSEDFLIRDVGQFSALTKKLFDCHFKYGIRESLNKLTKRLMQIDDFLHPENISCFFDMVFERTRYYKSIVVNLNPSATNIHDIDFIDIYYDSHYSLLPSGDKPFVKKGPIFTHRTGVWFRVYMKPEDCSFSIHQEKLNCVAQYPHEESIREDIPITDITKKRNSQYLVTSTEYHFKFHYDDFDSVMMLFLDTKKDELSKKFGYEVTVVDKHMLDLINMTLI